MEMLGSMLVDSIPYRAPFALKFGKVSLCVVLLGVLGFVLIACHPSFVGSTTRRPGNDPRAAVFDLVTAQPFLSFPLRET